MSSLVLAALAAVTSPSGLTFYDGRCIYPPELGEAGPNEVRLECNSVVVSERPDGDLLVQFALKGGGSIFGFAGDVDDHGTLSVRRIYPKPGTVVQATRGHCRIFTEHDKVSGITCVGGVEGQTFVANFEAD